MLLKKMKKAESIFRRYRNALQQMAEANVGDRREPPPDTRKSQVSPLAPHEKIKRLP